MQLAELPVMLKEMNARHFIISGYVQGVGFRWFTLRRARSLGLDGWVRNCSDGTVEVWAEGEETALDALEASLKGGPPGARVRDLRTESAVPTHSGGGFDVTY